MVPHEPFRWNGVAARVMELAETGSCDYAPGFIERARPAALGVLPRARSAVQSNFVTDLGVRASDDAATFLRHNLSRNPLGWDEGLDTGAAWPASGLDDDELAGLLDACVNFAGDWELARSICLAANADDRTDRGYATSLYVGAILAATSSVDDPDGEAAGDWLRRAISQADSEVDAFMAGLRLAAWLLKRRGDAEAATRQLRDMFRDVCSWASRRRVSAADADAMRAVGLNLLALVYVRSGDSEAALETVQSASKLRDIDGLVTVDPDAVKRYHCQIRINVAQVLWLLGDHDEAIQTLVDNEELATSQHPDSLSEAQSTLAYYLYLAGAYDGALTFLSSSYQLVRREAAPRRLAQIRKVTAAALHRSGAVAEAEHVLDRLRWDPLGFDARLVANGGSA